MYSLSTAFMYEYKYRERSMACWLYIPEGNPTLSSCSRMVESRVGHCGYIPKLCRGLYHTSQLLPAGCGAVARKATYMQIFDDLNGFQASLQYTENRQDATAQKYTKKMWCQFFPWCDWGMLSRFRCVQIFLSYKPVAPVAQRYLVTPWHVGTWVRFRQTGFFSLRNKIKQNKNAQRVENDYRWYTKFDFTVDEGKERLNPSREKT